MDGLVGYGSDDSENSKNSPAPKSEEKRVSQNSAQLEAEWESFQKLIGGENDARESDVKAPIIDAKDDSSSEDESDKEQAVGKRRRKKSGNSGSSSSGSSDKSDKSDSRSESSDASSNEESEDEKKKKKIEASSERVSVPKSPKTIKELEGKKRSRSPSSSSESETEHKVELGQRAEEANGQPDSRELKKERRASHRSSSPRRQSRSRDRHRKYRSRRSRSRSQQRRRRKRRPRHSRSRGRRSRSRGRRHRGSKTPERRSSSNIGEKGHENHSDLKSGDHQRSRSRSRTPKKRDRRRSSRSPRRRKRSGSRNRRHRRSRSPPLRRRRRRRKRRPSRRISRSRSRSRSRSKSPVVHKKRNEPLNYKEQLKQSLLQVQKQAAEGKLNLEELTTKGKDLLTPNEKPSALPLGSENPLVAMATGQLGHVTPQQALLQTMAAMHQKAQELTGVAVPKYYNPASVNPLKYAEQVQKRKLLWGRNKEKKEEEQPPGVMKPKTQWDGALFSQDQDGKQAEKFRKLMGIKKQDGTGACTSTGEKTEEEPDDSVMKKQQELFSRLDQEYEFARMATHTHRGVGLGFSSMHQYPNK